MDKFTIKDLENLSGIKAHTIRIWEQRYSFLKPHRTTTNIRYYSSEELKTLLNVSLLNKYGFKISHINRMSREDQSAKALSLSSAEAQQERIVNDLIRYMIDLDLDGFEKILDQYIALRGIENTITQIIFPYLERIGILWLTDHINPAQEHLITNIIRQKLIAGIDKNIPTYLLNSTALLFLPENEHHELSLLFLQFLLKNKGVKVIYLGANVPLKDLEYVVNLKKPDFVYTHLTTVIKEFNFDKFITHLKMRLPSSKILISGMLVHSFTKKTLPPNIRFLKSMVEVKDFMNTLK